ncbi:hypothetical protein MTBLM5_40145 [Magnetospirillum sp. LM-5]|nr:hypothetical protein MTBLM5_40145 [Magnetospirillum sp. LM-5]
MSSGVAKAQKNGVPAGLVGPYGLTDPRERRCSLRAPRGRLSVWATPSPLRRCRSPS